MASSKILTKLSPRLQSLKLSKSPSLLPSLSPQSPLSGSSKRISSSISRLPKELSSLASMMPLYSAIASARLTSNLAMESQSWSLVPNGISMPL